MTDKEQIIIDGKKEDCKILFRCKHIDDLAAYNMIHNGIKITSENAPIGDLELMLIENTDSPFGFSFLCKRNNKEDVWEYSGFGHSGACSIVTALLKQLDHKTQECEKLNNKIIDMNSIIEDAAINLGNKDFTLYDLPFEIKKLSQECENLKAEEKYLKQCCQKAGEELAKHSFEYDGKEKNLVVQAIELNEKYEKFKKALEEIEEVIDSIFDRCLWRKTDSCMPVYNVCEELIKILDIINKAKGETNA